MINRYQAGTDRLKARIGRKLPPPGGGAPGTRYGAAAVGLRRFTHRGISEAAPQLQNRTAGLTFPAGAGYNISVVKSNACD